MTLIMEVPVSTMALSQTYAQEFVYHDTIDRSWRGHFMSGTPEAVALTAGGADRGYAMSGDMESRPALACGGPEASFLGQG